MSLSPLKFSLGISLLVHGLLIGGVAWLGLVFSPRTPPPQDEPLALELRAAPFNSAALTANPPQPDIPPIAVAPPPLVQPDENTQSASITTPEPDPEPIAPMPAPQNSVPAPVPLVTATPIIPAKPLAADSDAVSRANSATTPGADPITVAGTAASLARPEHRKNPEPDYPVAARRRGQQGTVLLQVTVSPSGRAKAISLKQSSGFVLLDQAALRAVQDWEFEPARVGGIAVESQIEQAVRFRLRP